MGDEIPDEIKNLVGQYAGLGMPKLAMQVREYLSGERQSFDYPWSLFKFKTDFQRTVLKECSKIPFGETITYSQLARAIGSPKAARAVGTALGKNLYPIIIPCHRVTRGDGTIGEYSIGGSDNKKWLLDFEKSRKNNKLSR